MQGQPGGSLFVVVEGAVEVMLRRDDGSEVNLGTRPRGTVLGEMSLLTGEPRSATVRALDGALVYEVGRRQYEPVLAARPELVDALERAMEARLGRRASFSSATTRTAPAPASRAGSGGCWRVPELAEELQRVCARGVRAEGADVGGERLRQRRAAAA